MDNFGYPWIYLISKLLDISMDIHGYGYPLQCSVAEYRFQQKYYKKFGFKNFNRKKMRLKFDFDSSLTCYNLDPKSN
jgi:hypothetical protein